MYLTTQQADDLDDSAMHHLEIARDIAIDADMGCGGDDDDALCAEHTDRANHLWWLVDTLSHSR
jgi:hypothetical protein